MDDFFNDKAETRVKRRTEQLRKRGRQRLVFIIVAIAAAVLLLLLIAVLAVRASGSGQVAHDTGTGEALDAKASTVRGTASVQTSGTAEEPRTTTNTTSAAAPTPIGTKLAGKIIVIDPGHASSTDMGVEPTGPGSSETKVKDPGGTSGVVTGVREPVVTLAIARNLRSILEAKGAKVIMTRESDAFSGGNRERAQIANQAGAHLFIRIHCDGSDNSSTSGASTLYPTLIPGWTDDIFDQSSRAATAVQAALVDNLGVPDHGTVERSDMTGFNWADVPAILPEVGFMSNPDEDVKLNSADYQLKVAQALALGIENYFAGPN